eukprot:558548-Prymnesium_polylepis.1
MAFASWPSSGYLFTHVVRDCVRRYISLSRAMVCCAIGTRSCPRPFWDLHCSPSLARSDRLSATSDAYDARLPCTFQLLPTKISRPMTGVNELFSSPKQGKNFWMRLAV